MWELDCEESWAPKNWCFWTVVLEKSLDSLLDCKEIQPVHSEGDQSWVFIGRTDVDTETEILWPPDAKSWLIGKDPDAGKDWGQKEKGMTEDEMVGCHHRHNGREFEWTPGVGDGQGGLACCGSWDHKESDTTEPLNWTQLHVNQKHLKKKKKQYFPKQTKKLMRRMSLLYSIENLFSVWNKRSWLDFLICFCIQSVAICFFSWRIWRNQSSHKYVIGKIIFIVF